MKVEVFYKPAISIFCLDVDIEALDNRHDRESKVTKAILDKEFPNLITYTEKGRETLLRIRNATSSARYYEQ